MSFGMITRRVLDKISKRKIRAKTGEADQDLKKVEHVKIFPIPSD